MEYRDLRSTPRRDDIIQLDDEWFCPNTNRWNPVGVNSVYIGRIVDGRMQWRRPLKRGLLMHESHDPQALSAVRADRSLHVAPARRAGTSRQPASGGVAEERVEATQTQSSERHANVFIEIAISNRTSTGCCIFSEIRDATEEDIVKFYNNFPCDHTAKELLVYDIGSYLYDIRKCAVCHQTIGVI